MATIAFDVDDTLIIPAIASTGFDSDIPNYETIDLFHWYERQGHRMIVWSGGGVDYAKRWADKLGLKCEIWPKEKNKDVDIAYDDCDVDLAKVNIKVGRINNSISRKEWNEHNSA